MKHAAIYGQITELLRQVIELRNIGCASRRDLETVEERLSALLVECLPKLVDDLREAGMLPVNPAHGIGGGRASGDVVAQAINGIREIADRLEEVGIGHGSAPVRSGVDQVAPAGGVIPAGPRLSTGEVVGVKP